MTITIWLLFALGHSSGSYSSTQPRVLERFISQDECSRVQDLLRAVKQSVWCVQATIYRGQP
jgi:hypothetical protein